MASKIASKLRRSETCIRHLRRFSNALINLQFERPFISYQRVLTSKSQLKSAVVGCNGISSDLISRNESKQFHTSSNHNGEVLPFNLSDIGEGIAEVTIKEWFVEEGSKVSQFDSICEVQSDKASVTITSKFDGVIKHIYYSVDDIARVGTALVDIEVTHDQEAEVDEERLFEDEPTAQQLPTVEETTQNENEQKKEEASNPVSESRTNTGKSGIATPAVRRLAMEHNLKLSDITGSGKDGRILKEDILQYLEKSASGIKLAKVSEARSQPAVHSMKEDVKSVKHKNVNAEDRVEPLTGIRKAMVKAMNNAINIPHFGYCDEINADSLIRFWSLATTSPTEFRIIASGKRQSSAHSKHQSEDLAKVASHNIGVAMDTADGLIVPNVKEVENKSILDIAFDLNRLHKLGLAGKLGPSDITNGTISLSNIGSISGTYAKPVILPPEVAIAAIGKIQKLPRFDENGNVYAANIFNISWSADHRVIEGAVMARFSDLWKSYVENPDAMLLHLK